MNVSYIIDTDWIVHHLSGAGKIRAKLAELQPDGLALSVISLAELYESVYYSRDPKRSQQRLEDFLSSITVLGHNARYQGKSAETHEPV